jgi:small subunit ribosomal protein S17
MSIAVTETQNQSQSKKSTLQGVVVSNKMQKTIVVRVDRRVRHVEYKKYITLSKKYKVHDPAEQANPGDWVEIVSCRPQSLEKRWALRKIIEHSKLLQLEAPQEKEL